MNKTLKSSLYTLGFYALLIALLFLSDHLSPGGPCVPGLGIIALIYFIPWVVGIAFVTTLILAIKGRNNMVIPTIVHGIVLVALILTVGRSVL